MLTNPHHFLHHVYLGCTQRECKPNETFKERYIKMFESRISAGATEKLPVWRQPHAKTVAWSYDMEGHASNCFERCCELANKKVEQLHKVSSPCLDDHQFKQEELESVGESPEVCSRIVLTCLYLSIIGRPDILWSVTNSSRAVTKWTRDCDRRIARLIAYIHNMSGYRQYCHVGNTAVLLGLGRDKVLNWECLFVHRQQGLLLSVYVDDIILAGLKQHLNTMTKKMMKLVDLGEPTSFLDHVYLGSTQRECKSNESIVEKCSNHESLPEL